MKKGCFLFFITLITIIVSVSIYLFRNDGEIFKKYSKEKIMNFAYNKIVDEIDKIQDKTYSDSLKILLQNEVQKIKNENFDLAMNKIGMIGNLIKEYSFDGKIDSVEFNKIKLMVFDNERSKKN